MPHFFDSSVLKKECEKSCKKTNLDYKFEDNSCFCCNTYNFYLLFTKIRVFLSQVYRLRLC